MKDFKVKTTFTATDKVSPVVDKMQNKVLKFSAKASMSVRKMDRVFGNIAGKMNTGLKIGFGVAAAGATALGGAVGWLMTQFSKVEDARAAFTPLMKGADRAKMMVDALNETAATTPFQFETLAGVANVLLPTMNGNIEKTIEFTRMMGDVAGGNVQKMGSVSRGFTKAMLKGKTDMESLNIIAEAGVPIFQEMSRVLGIPQDKMFKSVRDGKVSTDDLVKTFKAMTGKGGLFFKGMEIASKTLTGRISTLKDVVVLTAADIGEQLAPHMKDLVEWMIKGAEKVKRWVAENKKLIATKVTEFVKKIPYYLEKIAYWAPKIGKYVLIFNSIAIATKAARAAMWLFNAAAVAASTNIGKVSTSAKAMNAIPGQVNAGTASVGKFGAAMKALPALIIGLEIGTIIHDEFVEPMMKAHDQVNKMIGGIQAGLEFGPEKLPSYAIEEDIKKVREAKKAVDKDTFRKLTDPLGFTRAIEKQSLTMAEARLQRAWMTAKGREFVRDQPKQSVFTVTPDWEAPVTTMSTKSTEHKETVEVVISDDTGRARITRGGKGKRVKLAHTGAMP